MQALLVMLFFSACAVGYYDSDTNTQHLVGLGHLTMRVPDQSQASTYNQVKSYGLGLIQTQAVGFLSLGYADSTLLTLKDNETLCVEWPTSKLMDVKIGFNFSIDNKECSYENEVLKTSDN